MASTYTRLHYHIVFATKERTPFIEKRWERRLHGYLVRLAEGLGAKVLATGGVNDHVHMLVGLKPTHCVSDFMRELKKQSSGWVNEEGLCRRFEWQVGYGCFGTDGKRIDGLRAYIANQEEHHKTISSREELLALCREAGVEVDMRYFE